MVDQNLKKNIQESFESKRKRFQKTPFLSLSERVSALKKLKKTIKLYEEEVILALHQDFNKPAVESYITEISLAYQEIEHSISHLKDWMREKKVHTPLYLFPSRSRYRYVPKGVVLILSPWNYPFLLIMDPLINVIAAGNNVIAKLPNQTPKTSKIIAKIISESFDTGHASTLIMEDVDVIPELIDPYRFDHIFFTGSARVGKLIYSAAAKQLIPVTLELGGKTPCIVDETASISLSAKRIAWAKMVNAGQTCVAPDYILVDEKVKTDFIKQLKHFISVFHSDSEESDYAHLIHDKRFESISGIKKKSDVISGGQENKASRYSSPTLVEVKSTKDPAMQEEIFGPVLPILGYNNFDDVRSIVDENSHPLALYIFSKNKKRIATVLKEFTFGGACVNDCLLHLGVSDLPFGGIGSSGMGSYHGFEGFQTFSQKKSVVKSSTWFDIPFKYPPYTTKQFKLLKRLLKLK